jgi:hypothetical protein
VIAPNLKWDEEELPATDILGARLRAKFYGAQVITYRKFLLSILQLSPNEKIKPDVVQYAIRCIKALIKSTMAFHGLGDPGSKRLLVTNIWGTAHACVVFFRLHSAMNVLTGHRQWGNVLTLQAAYLNPILRNFVDAQVLQDLLTKTLAFLSLHSQRSSALFTDYQILQHTGRETGMPVEIEPVS